MSFPYPMRVERKKLGPETPSVSQSGVQLPGLIQGG